MIITPYHLKAYNVYNATATASDKKSLEEAFGVTFFKSKITDIIKSLDDIYIYLDLNRELVIPFKNPSTKQERSINAMFDIQNISKVLNGNWVLDWKNTNECKYYPYFKKEDLSGWAIGTGYCCDCYNARLGFGCYFKTSDLTLFAGKTFLETYIDYLPE